MVLPPACLRCLFPMHSFLLTCLFAGPTMEEVVAPRASFASIIWIGFLGWVGCSLMLHTLASGSGRQGETAQRSCLETRA